MSRSLWRRTADYFGNPDPRLSFGGTIAMAVVGNQPFYPLYVSYVAGIPVWPAALTWLSTPFFAAAPILMRRSPAFGRVLLLAAALLNTVLSAKALGTASGVELFYAPCLLLGFGLFAPGHRALPVASVLAAITAGLAVSRLDGPPIQALSAAQSDGLWRMNMISVLCLITLMLFMLARMSRVSRTA